jgi:hypothetical protein
MWLGGLYGRKIRGTTLWEEVLLRCIILIVPNPHCGDVATKYAT